MLGAIAAASIISMLILMKIYSTLKDIRDELRRQS